MFSRWAGAEGAGAGAAVLAAAAVFAGAAVAAAVVVAAEVAGAADAGAAAAGAAAAPGGLDRVVGGVDRRLILAEPARIRRAWLQRHDPKREKRDSRDQKPDQWPRDILHQSNLRQLPCAA